MFAVTGRYAFSLCKKGERIHDYETYLSEKRVFSMELIFESTTKTQGWVVWLDARLPVFDFFCLKKL